MAYSLKSNSKPAAKKAVVGKSKKKTVWWKKLYLGSAVFLLVGAVGFSGYTWWQDKYGTKAQAYSWSVVASGGGLYARSCLISGSGYTGRYYKYYSNYTAYPAKDQYGNVVNAHSNSRVSGVSWGTFTLSNGRTTISGNNETTTRC